MISNNEYEINRWVPKEAVEQPAEPISIVSNTTNSYS
jgi:hypothetical protein